MLSRRHEKEDEIILTSFFLGLVVNYLFWGIQITQSYNYYKHFRKTDNKWLKGAVGLLFIAEAIQSIGTSACSWSFLVQGVGEQPPEEQFTGWGGWLIPFMDAFTASIVHLLYAQKIWTLLKAPSKYICTAVVVSLSCLQFTGGLGCSVFMFSNRLSLGTFYRIKTWACIWLVTAGVTDVIITVVMVWKLSHSRTGIKETDNIITKLIRLNVETGLATSIVQFANVIIYLIWPDKPYHVIFSFIDPKVYSNSMLAILNSRQLRSIDGKWDARQDKFVDSIHIHTTRTVNVTTDYELGDRSSSHEPSENIMPTFKLKSDEKLHG